MTNSYNIKDIIKKLEMELKLKYSISKNNFIFRCSGCDKIINSNIHSLCNTCKKWDSIYINYGCIYNY
jgi:rRNA maturation endonuclease Nob1